MAGKSEVRHQLTGEIDRGAVKGTLNDLTVLPDKLSNSVLFLSISSQKCRGDKDLQWTCERVWFPISKLEEDSSRTCLLVKYKPASAAS